MRRPRRNHSPSFKAKGAMATIRGDKTLAELADRSDVHANQIQDWKRQLLEKAAQVFGNTGHVERTGEATVQRLYAKIGELTRERDFLSKALGRVRCASAKRGLIEGVACRWSGSADCWTWLARSCITKRSRLPHAPSS